MNINLVKKQNTLILLAIVLISLMTACSNKGSVPVKKIDADTARGMINQEPVIVLDVREKEEYDAGHIPNAVLLPLGKIDSKFGHLLPDKNAKILIYCRSGRRSAEAGSKLKSLGYINLYDFGGILDWPYETVKE